jgi:hypothetical protein
MDVTAPAPRFGERPTTAERVDLLEHQLAEALARIAALEARGDADDQIDGVAPAPLPPQWQPLKAACAVAGFSPSGLRKRIATHRDGPRWWKYRGSRLWIDIAACPRKVSTRTATRTFSR